MRLVPRSLFGRLLALSLAATLVALAAAGIAIGGVLEHFVTATIDARLADRVLAIESAVGDDGTIDAVALGRIEARIPAREPWRVDAPRGSAGTRGPDGILVLTFGDDPHFRDVEARRGRRGPPDALPAGVRPFDAQVMGGPPVHGLISTVATRAGEATVLVTVSRGVIDRPIRAALLPLALCLLALGGALALAAIVQLRLGLRPLTRLRADVAAVRGGSAERLPEEQPEELAPLTDELNALLADNDAALAAARSSAANLAHGLKTPLATLALTIGEPGRDPDGRLAGLVDRLDATVRHHLGRARASVAGGGRASTMVGPVAEEIATALRHIHAGLAVSIAVDAPAGLAVAVDRTDLEEMIGNLADNAMRWAASRVAVRATSATGMAVISVSDDGPGIAPGARARAMAHGTRLDERGDGHGFGLAIVRELAELYRGSLALDETPGGGLTATLTLPTAR